MAKLKVLIVDDEPGICSGISRILSNFSVSFPFLEESFTFETMETGTGEEAVEILDVQGADIVLLDNKLPGIYGIDVLEYINKKQMDCNVMMITSYASLDLAIKATNNGAYNFVPKPFTPQELKTAMEGITKNLYLRRMTNRLNNQEKQLRNKFLAILSHELKLPLSAIEGYLRIMKDKLAGDKIEDYDEMINRSLERMKGIRSLITDLLDLTKIESDKQNKVRRKIDITDIAANSCDAISPMAIQKNVKVTIEAEPKQLYFLSEPETMEIIFNNLISNAVKYNRDNGEVKCSINELPDYVEITVADTGIGMSEEDLPKLFQEFVRIKNEKTVKITGSGLGLSITKKIVEEYYHGTITVKSTPDEGTAFTVKLPKTEEEPGH
ncbi:MAG TPA: ATP-binding protein [Spirochaetota bacterium]|nr:ATP-binding protein [Spirochaetota bacterium]HPF07885.1 ATP-binding protein [Spirochaetota bacterium]HPJ44123.1 ATP-binding protein [Spirochaetota bacterium]HPR39201.1 ATP-binding protein [Spirochaetota bacterium]